MTSPFSCPLHHFYHSYPYTCRGLAVGVKDSSWYKYLVESRYLGECDLIFYLTKFSVLVRHFSLKLVVVLVLAVLVQGPLRHSYLFFNTMGPRQLWWRTDRRRGRNSQLSPQRCSLLQGNSYWTNKQFNNVAPRWQDNRKHDWRYLAAGGGVGVCET